MRTTLPACTGSPGYMLSTQSGLRQPTGQPSDATMTDMLEVAVVWGPQT